MVFFVRTHVRTSPFRPFAVPPIPGRPGMDDDVLAFAKLADCTPDYTY